MLFETANNKHFDLITYSGKYANGNSRGSYLGVVRVSNAVQITKGSRIPMYMAKPICADNGQI